MSGKFLAAPIFSYRASHHNPVKRGMHVRRADEGCAREWDSPSGRLPRNEQGTRQRLRLAAWVRVADSILQTLPRREDVPEPAAYLTKMCAPCRASGREQMRATAGA